MILYWIRILNQVEVDGELLSASLALRLSSFIAQATGDFVRLFWRWKANSHILVLSVSTAISTLNKNPNQLKVGIRPHIGLQLVNLLLRISPLATQA